MSIPVDLSSVLLGSSLALDWPTAGAGAALLPLFAIALWRTPGAAGRWCLAAALAGCLGLCFGTEGLWLLTSLTIASYGLLAATAARAGRGQGAALAVAMALIVLGDLSLFELVLVAADIVGGTGVPLFPRGADIAGKEGFLLTLAAVGIGSRGALLLPARRSPALLAPIIGLLLLALPLAAWRAAGSTAAAAVPALAIAGLGVAAAAAAAGRRAAAIPAPRRPGALAPIPQLPVAALVAGLARAEQGLRSWTVAMVIVVCVLLALLAASILPAPGG